MSTTEVHQLTRMRNITTYTFVGTGALVGGLALIISAGTWWHPVLIAPALMLALWIASRWHSPPRPSVLFGSLLIAEITWAVAILVGVAEPAVTPLAMIGGVVVATRPSSRPLWALALLALMSGTALLSIVNNADNVVGYVVGSLFYASIFVVTFWLNDIAWKLFVELDAMRRSDAELAVVKERMRFAADLHDIQGHTLHVIKLKAAIAARLQHTDPERVAHELAEFERLTGETIDQPQLLVNSTRQLSFASELVNATALMTAAGMEVDASGGDTRITANEDLFALVLREGTTNILRHPVARKVDIAITADALPITNDGATGTVRPERGLAGLRDRVAQSGGTLEVSHEADAFTLGLTCGRVAA